MNRLSLIRFALVVLGVIALTKADLNSESVLYRVILPLYAMGFLACQFTLFIRLLKVEGVLSKNWDGNVFDMFDLLYEEREGRYQQLFYSLGGIGVLLTIIAVWLDLGVFLYGVFATFKQVGLIVNA